MKLLYRRVGPSFDGFGFEHTDADADADAEGFAEIMVGFER